MTSVSLIDRSAKCTPASGQDLKKFFNIGPSSGDEGISHLGETHLGLSHGANCDASDVNWLESVQRKKKSYFGKSLDVKVPQHSAL